MRFIMTYENFNNQEIESNVIKNDEVENDLNFVEENHEELNIPNWEIY